MMPYQSKSGKDSGVKAYEIGPEYIRVLFSNGAVYLYTHNSAGWQTVEAMKTLAREQEGLSTFISRNDPGFE